MASVEKLRCGSTPTLALNLEHKPTRRRARIPFAILIATLLTAVFTLIFIHSQSLIAGWLVATTLAWLFVYGAGKASDTDVMARAEQDAKNEPRAD